MRYCLFLLCATLFCGCAFSQKDAAPEARPPRVQSNGFISKANGASKESLAWLVKSIGRMVEARVNCKAAIEVNARGVAVRVGIVGEGIKSAEALDLGIVVSLMLHLYFDDVSVSINKYVFRPKGFKPNDGSV